MYKYLIASLIIMSGFDTSLFSMDFQKNDSLLKIMSKHIHKNIVNPFICVITTPKKTKPHALNASLTHEQEQDAQKFVATIMEMPEVKELRKPDVMCRYDAQSRSQICSPLSIEQVNDFTKKIDVIRAQLNGQLNNCVTHSKNSSVCHEKHQYIQKKLAENGIPLQD